MQRYGFTAKALDTSLTGSDRAPTTEYAALTGFLLGSLTPDFQAKMFELIDVTDPYSGFKLWQRLNLESSMESKVQSKNMAIISAIHRAQRAAALMCTGDVPVY